LPWPAQQQLLGSASNSSSIQWDLSDLRMPGNNKEAGRRPAKRKDASRQVRFSFISFPSNSSQWTETGERTVTALLLSAFPQYVVRRADRIKAHKKRTVQTYSVSNNLCRTSFIIFIWTSEICVVLYPLLLFFELYTVPSFLQLLFFVDENKLRLLHKHNRAGL